MEKEEQKKLAGEKACEYIKQDMVVGVGSGSTVHYFIEALDKIKHQIDGAVASSLDTEKKLKALGIPVVDLNIIDKVDVYVDGADEITPHMQMVKGGGGAATREKIIAATAKKFICIVDESKWVKRLGEFPVAVEVLPMARSYVARELVRLGGSPEYREGFVTDNNNILLDVYELPLSEPLKMEQTINNIPGVVGNGIFAYNPANFALVGNTSGEVELFKAS